MSECTACTASGRTDTGSRTAAAFGFSFIQMGIDARGIACDALPVTVTLRTTVFPDGTNRKAFCRTHRATSSTSSLEDRIERSLSETNPTAVSIALRVVNSVQHHKAAFPSSG